MVSADNLLGKHKSTSLILPPKQGSTIRKIRLYLLHSILALLDLRKMVEFSALDYKTDDQTAPCKNMGLTRTCRYFVEYSCYKSTGFYLKTKFFIIYIFRTSANHCKTTTHTKMSV